MAHIPVLQNEVIKYLDPRPGENFIDGTCGGAGHTWEILKKIKSEGKILCFDLDQKALRRAQEKLKREKQSGQVIFINDNFANLERVVKANNFFPVDGILLDLGMSSDQLDSPAGEGRGFSFLKNEPLDMRYSTDQELSAAEIINQWSPQELVKILKEYGEERFARNIAREIVRARQIKPIISSQKLVEVVASAIPEKYKHGRIHFATKTFQALRIAVNDELANLEKFLPQALTHLNRGGKLVVISFHSLEDRIVKNFFRQKVNDGQVEILTKKPVSASEREIAANPRSRSAKLRAIRKI